MLHTKSRLASTSFSYERRDTWELPGGTIILEVCRLLDQRGKSCRLHEPRHAVLASRFDIQPKPLCCFILFEMQCSRSTVGEARYCSREHGPGIVRSAGATARVCTISTVVYLEACLTELGTTRTSDIPWQRLTFHTIYDFGLHH